MTRKVLPGISGANPLGFLSALGLLSIVQRESDMARLGFQSDGSFLAYMEGSEIDLAKLVAKDAESAAGSQGWRLEYEKVEKNKTKLVADLKAPPDIFRRFLVASVNQWCKGDLRPAAYAAAFGTDIAVDGKGNTKPTAFHFTAAQQEFLGTAEAIRATVSEEWVHRSLFEGAATQSGKNLRWDPSSERNWALMANNPIDEGTIVDAPLEWLAFRALALVPSFPRGARIFTTAVSGRGDDLKFRWPLWSVPASVSTIRSLVTAPLPSSARERLRRGIFALCSSSIRRSKQGFGNFGPASVT